MKYLYIVFDALISLCYRIASNYGIAIILFTVLSKIILLPLSIWVQKNSIKMVQMMPELNRIKIKYYGDKDAVAEEEQKLYKKNGYNPLSTLVPTIVQLLVLIGLIGAIRQNINSGAYNLGFLGMDLGVVPSKIKGIYYIFPLMAGISSWCLCVFQNKNNALQAEQGKGMQYGTLVFSVGISLWLGFFVPAGVAVYWIASNLLSIVQQLFLNRIYDPKKSVDYDELEKTKKELDELGNIGKRKRTPEEKRREREDYRRFFKIENKHLVFYSEGSGFYKYFKGIIEHILDNTNITIHYITSDPNDRIFSIASENPQIKAYYIGENKLITLMMKMDADIVAMTTPDLDNYQLKRSYMRKDIEYIYVQHHMGSINMILRKGSVDNFDTVFICGTHHEEEIRRTEDVYGLHPKTLVRYGFPLLDEMIESYEGREGIPDGEGRKDNVLIAPSWHSEGIMNTCISTLLEALEGTDYIVTVRPHPQYVRHNREQLDAMAKRYAGSNIQIQVDFSSNDTVLDAHCLITDWSSIAFEYAFATGRPVLFVDTPMKVHNPEYLKIGVEPFDIWIRNKVGMSMRPDEAGDVKTHIDRMLGASDTYRKDIFALRDSLIFNVGSSSEHGAEYIIGSLLQKAQSRRGSHGTDK